MLSVNGLLLQVDKGNVGKIVSRIQIAVTTTIEEVDLKTTCRVCLGNQQPADLFSLFGLNKMFQELSIASAIYECFGVELPNDDVLPKYVCIKCASNTLHSYTFKKCLKKCQGYLNKHTAGVKDDAPVKSANKEKYLSGDQEPIDLDSVETVVNLDHSYNLQGIEVDGSVLTEHNYCKEEIIDKSKNDDQQNNPEKEPYETKETSKRENGVEIIKSNIKTSPEANNWWCKGSGPPYECKICGREFGVRFRAFYMHARIHRLPKQPCTYCNKLFSRDKLKIHLRTHTQEKPYVCDKCPARFGILGNLTRHLRCHSGEKPFICEICGKAFTQSTNLNNHKQAHEGQTLFVCVYCGKTFHSENSHRAHLHLQHKKMKSDSDNTENSELKKFSCKVCSRAFNNVTALKSHARIHSHKSYFCAVCFKRFTNHLNYRIHKSWHELIATDSTSDYWSCEFCTDVFNEKNDLVAHLLKHMERPYVCNICGNTYGKKVILMQHLRLHTNEKPFPCKICSKAFKCSASLKQHLRVHTGEKPYKCDVCSRLFAQQQQLISHSFTHTGEKKYICPYCGKAFALKGNLTVHKRRHTGETPFVCSQCGKGFYDSSSLKKHSVLHTDKVRRNKGNEEIKKDGL